MVNRAGIEAAGPADTAVQQIHCVWPESYRAANSPLVAVARLLQSIYGLADFNV